MIVLPIFITAFILQLILPWWVIGPIAFLTGCFQAESGKHAFKSGFISLFLLWLMISLWKSLPNENLLASRVAQLLMLPDWAFSWIFIVLLTSSIGGIVSGSAAMSGFFFRKAFIKSPAKK